MFLILIFWYFILPNTFLLIFFIFWLEKLAFLFVLGLICFCIFKSNVLTFCKNSVFWFCLLNSAYLADDHTLVCSYAKMFQSNLTTFISSYLSFSFWFYLLEQATCRTGILLSAFPSLQTLFFNFWFTVNAKPCKRDIFTIIFHVFFQTNYT